MGDAVDESLLDDGRSVIGFSGIQAHKQRRGGRFREHYGPLGRVVSNSLSNDNLRAFSLEVASKPSPLEPNAAHPLTLNEATLHQGLDFPAPVGTTVLSAAGGVVVTQEVQPHYGLVIEIDHGNEVLTRYAHLSRAFVKKGDLIKRGQKMAEVGNTGRSTGPHLHFEVLVRGVAQDPQKFLALGQSGPGKMAKR